MKKEKGFTLIELLIVIAIIAVLAGVVFVALNPLKRFKDSRDSRRAADIQSILTAIKVHQADNGGYLMNPIESLAAGTTYMIGDGSTVACGLKNADCATIATTTGGCLNLNGSVATTSLVLGGYLGSIPISPNGTGSWNASTTGYTLYKSSTGAITIRACEVEGPAELVFSR
jgi:prepilin-type N-terminal cleavage/methylation domain-containing protein